MVVGEEQHMPGALFTACGWGAVRQPHQPHRASTSKPAVPAATFLCSCLFWSSGRRTASEPRVICGSAVHVNAHVRKVGGKVVYLFIYFLCVRVCACVFVCMAEDVVCVLPSHAQHNIYT